MLNWCHDIETGTVARMYKQRHARLYALAVSILSLSHPHRNQLLAGTEMQT